MKNLIIHGWRDINHSFSIVNQNQIIHLSESSNYNIFHFDENKYNPKWTNKRNSANFDIEKEKLINSIQIPNKSDYKNSIIYSINFPFLSYTNKKIENSIFHFIVTEFGISKKDLFLNKELSNINNSINEYVITPSLWSKNKLINSGLDANKIFVIPHGVDKYLLFMQSTNVRNQLRTNFGINENEYCFLNLSSMTYNKGIDLLLLSYIKLFKKYPFIKLILKDQFNLYDISAQDQVSLILKSYPEYDNFNLRKSIIVISENLSSEQLNFLYNIADCYVSPYRAEGFNMPVIEALACGCPVIVTANGATDDFVNVHCKAWYKISSTLVPNTDLPFNLYNSDLGNDFHLLPDLNSLYQNMETSIFNKSRNHLLSSYIRENFNWKSISNMMLKLFSKY